MLRRVTAAKAAVELATTVGEHEPSAPEARAADEDKRVGDDREANSNHAPDEVVQQLFDGVRIRHPAPDAAAGIEEPGVVKSATLYSHERLVTYGSPLRAMTNEPIVGIRNMIDQPTSKTKGPNHTGGRLEKNT
jgi:hypothetical protein